MAKKQVGTYRARPFRMSDAEELESMLSSAGLDASSIGSSGLTDSLVNAVLALSASPNSKERFGRFVADVWQHPLQAEIDEAEDNEDYEEAVSLRNKKRKEYRRAAPTARNEILKSLYEQQAFKDFLSGYLSLLPSDMQEQVRGGMRDALASMNERVAKSSGATESAKSAG